MPASPASSPGRKSAGALPSACGARLQSRRGVHDPRRAGVRASRSYNQRDHSSDECPRNEADCNKRGHKPLEIRHRLPSSLLFHRSDRLRSLLLRDIGSRSHNPLLQSICPRRGSERIPYQRSYLISRMPSAIRGARVSPTFLEAGALVGATNEVVLPRDPANLAGTETGRNPPPVLAISSDPTHAKRKSFSLKMWPNQRGAGLLPVRSARDAHSALPLASKRKQRSDGWYSSEPVISMNTPPARVENLTSIAASFWIGRNCPLRDVSFVSMSPLYSGHSTFTSGKAPRCNYFSEGNGECVG